MILDVLSDSESAFASARLEPRPARSLLAGAAASLMGAGFLLLYLRHIDFHSVTISAGPFGFVDVTTALLLRVYVWMALIRLVVYPTLYHGVASLLGGEATLAAGLDAHARLTVAAVVVYDVGTAATFTWQLPSLVWQAVFAAWGIWLHFPLARAVYGLTGTRRVIALAAAVALGLLLLASILLTLLPPNEYI